MIWSFAYEFVAQGIWDEKDFKQFVSIQCGAIFMTAWRQATTVAKETGV